MNWKKDEQLTKWFLSFQRDSGNGLHRLISCEGLILPAALPGSSRRHSVRTNSDVKLVNDLICSQEGQPGTSKSQREIARYRLAFRVLRLQGLWIKTYSSECFVAVKFSRCQHDQSRNNQRCYWPVAQTTAIVRSHGGHVEHHFH